MPTSVTTVSILLICWLCLLPCHRVLAAGAVFEASLPPDLADMYRGLAVLLPQAPVPLLTLLQLWGISDPQEARETLQIFVMQVRLTWCTVCMVVVVGGIVRTPGTVLRLAACAGRLDAATELCYITRVYIRQGYLATEQVTWHRHTWRRHCLELCSGMQAATFKGSKGQQCLAACCIYLWQQAASVQCSACAPSPVLPPCTFTSPSRLLACVQGVLKVATLPDGATWIMPSPEHQQFVKVGHQAKHCRSSLYRVTCHMASLPWCWRGRHTQGARLLLCARSCTSRLCPYASRASLNSSLGCS